MIFSNVFSSQNIQNFNPLHSRRKRKSLNKTDKSVNLETKETSRRMSGTCT